MKKSQLRKLIRESIKELMTEKQTLNEIAGCHFHPTSGACGPSHCTTHPSGGGEKCACRTFLPGSDDCDKSDTGSYSGDFEKQYKKQPRSEIKGMEREPILPSTDTAVEWCTCRYYRCKKDTSQTNSTLSWGGCTGSGACGCMSGNKTGGHPSLSTKF